MRKSATTLDPNEIPANEMWKIGKKMLFLLENQLQVMYRNNVIKYLMRLTLYPVAKLGDTVRARVPDVNRARKKKCTC